MRKGGLDFSPSSARTDRRRERPFLGCWNQPSLPRSWTVVQSLDSLCFPSTLVPNSQPAGLPSPNNTSSFLDSEISLCLFPPIYALILPRVFAPNIYVCS
uniref:Uncharacterized protein n=1 Tax=Knipowitschia caucasica TaxID=637954 RepID=A0AAV2MS66_KNICA